MAVLDALPIILTCGGMAAFYIVLAFINYRMGVEAEKGETLHIRLAALLALFQVIIALFVIWQYSDGKTATGVLEVNFYVNMIFGVFVFYKTISMWLLTVIRFDVDSDKKWRSKKKW